MVCLCCVNCLRRGRVQMPGMEAPLRHLMQPRALLVVFVIAAVLELVHFLLMR